MFDYIGLIRKDPDSEYGIDFPDFPGCISAGSTLEEVREMGTEALNFHVETMLEQEEDLPAPSSMDEVMADPENQGAELALLVTIAPTKGTRRISITIPEVALRRIDRYAQEIGIKRSQLLVRGALKIAMSKRLNSSS